jgi:hypothetical protein
MGAVVNKRELELLEKFFEKEIEGALNHHLRLYQTKSKLAAKLVDGGYLCEREYVLGGRFPVKVRGYELTELGRVTYCFSCDGD